MLHNWITYRLIRCHVSTLSSSIQAVKYPTFQTLTLRWRRSWRTQPAAAGVFCLVKVEFVAYNSNVNILKPLWVSVPLETALLVSEAASLKNERITTLRTECYVKLHPSCALSFVRGYLSKDLTEFNEATVVFPLVCQNIKMCCQIDIGIEN